MTELPFTCEKEPATGSGEVVVTNHPLGTAAGYEILAGGGNAVDAAVGALLALCVVEPMMVGIAGGGLAHVRLADGSHTVVDGMAHAPASVTPDIYEPVSDTSPRHMDTKDRRSEQGPSAVAVPGNLAAWCEMHRRWGRLAFADVIDPAIRLAERGFLVTHYLEGAIREAADDLVADPSISALFLPDGAPCPAGSRLTQPDFGQSLRMIASEGAAALHGGSLGAALARRIATGGADAGWVTESDLTGYVPRDRAVIRADYRGYEVVGPPPPASSGVHIVQMLNLIEHHDIAALGFGTTEGLHLLAEVLRIGFEERRAASGDPDFIDIPVERLTSKAFAIESQARLRNTARPSASIDGYESANTTHVTLADADGNVVSATHTINGIFGARFMVPETGIIPNNYMMNFDPHPGRALSVAPGKRVPTSMAPMMALRDGRLRWALGLSGGLRIFPSAFQTIINLIDHGMTLQQAIEAPRIFTEGNELEIEKSLAPCVEELTARGHKVRVVPHVGGGMNAIECEPDGSVRGAACWRADGTAAAVGGGQARPGVRFWPGRSPTDEEMTP